MKKVAAFLILTATLILFYLNTGLGFKFTEIIGRPEVRAIKYRFSNDVAVQPAIIDYQIENGYAFGFRLPAYQASCDNGKHTSLMLSLDGVYFILNLSDGSYIEFKWNTTTKEFTMLQRPRTQETLLLLCYNYRPDEQLLADYLASQWIKDYTVATCKYMLGEARSKFAQIAGPQGGSSLNGDALKAEAQAELEKLEMDVSQQVAGGMGYGFTIG